jgi:hypothetical protein
MTNETFRDEPIGGARHVRVLLFESCTFFGLQVVINVRLDLRILAMVASDEASLRHHPGLTVQREFGEVSVLL